MGETFPVYIESIRLIEHALDLQKVISAITALDISISERRPPPSYKHCKSLSLLFNYILNGKLDKNINRYVYNTFNHFRRNKQKILIDLDMLDQYKKTQSDGKFLNLLLHKFQSFHSSEEYKLNMNNINILRPQFFEIFPNIEVIEIYASDMHGFRTYIFSLSELLSIIQGTAVDRVTVHIFRIRQGQSWMEKLWASSQETFVRMYAKKNFVIKMDTEHDYVSHVEVTIQRN